MRRIFASAVCRSTRRFCSSTAPTSRSRTIAVNMAKRGSSPLDRSKHLAVAYSLSYIRGAAQCGGSSVSGRPMTGKSGNTVRISRDEALRRAREWATPENLARLDAMTDDDIAAQIAEDADVAPELTDEWF